MIGAALALMPEEGRAAIIPRQVLVIGVPPLLSDVIVQALTAEPGIARVEAAPGGADADPVVPEDVTLVILGAELSTDERVAALLARRPRAAVMLIEGDGARASLVELWPERRDLGELSPEGLRAAARATTAWDERFTGVALGPGDRM
jgi:chemotaxis response regulator CheB